MRIKDTPEMEELWNSIEPYLSHTSGDPLVENAPEIIKEKFNKYMELFKIEEKKEIAALFN